MKHHEYKSLKIGAHIEFLAENKIPFEEVSLIGGIVGADPAKLDEFVVTLWLVENVALSRLLRINVNLFQSLRQNDNDPKCFKNLHQPKVDKWINQYRKGVNSNGRWESIQHIARLLRLERTISCSEIKEIKQFNKSFAILRKRHLIKWQRKDWLQRAIS